jgi:hypothetical protein
MDSPTPARPALDPPRAGVLRRMSDALRRLAFLAALGAIACASALLFAERGGWLARKLQVEFSAQLGDDVEIEGVRLDWFSPSVEVTGLHLRDAPELLRIDTARADFEWHGWHKPILRRVELDGGRVRLSEQLFQRIERVAASLTPSNEPTADTLARAVPLVIVRDVQLELSHPAWGEIALGHVDALCRASNAQRIVLEGRIRPSFTEASDSAPHEIYLAGSRDSAGRLELSATCPNLPLSSSAFPKGTPLEPVRAWEPHAELAFEARAAFDPAGGQKPSGHLRAMVSHGSLQAPMTTGPLVDIGLDLDAHCTPRELGALLDPRAWESTAHLTAQWNRAPLDAWATVGRNAGPGLAARAWFSAPRCDLSREFLKALGIGSRFEESWHALEPTGVASFSCGLSWPNEAAENDFAGVASPIATFDIEASGAAGITYFGWRNSHGRTEGFPLPIEKINGRVVGLHDARLTHATQLAFLRVIGSHSGGTASEQPAFAEGMVLSPATEAGHTLFDLRFGAHGVPIDGQVKRGLEGLEGTEFIWPDFSPSGGNASVAARLYMEEEQRTPAITVDIDLFGVDGAWLDLPVPVRGIDGHLTILADPRRPVGVGFRLRGETATGSNVSIAGRVQDDPAPQLEDRPWRERRIQAFDVVLGTFPLRGADFDALAASLPEVGEQIEFLGAQGKADARFSGATVATGGAFDYKVEVTPHLIQITPESFRVQARGVRGRVLVDAHEDPRAPPEQGRVNSRVAPLVGDWPAGARVGCIASFPGHEEATVQLFGAGIDLTNTGLVGAFRESLALNAGSGYGGVDLAALDVDGRVDFTGSLTLPRAVPAKPVSIYRVYLRDNDVDIGTLGKTPEPTSPPGVVGPVQRPVPALGHFNGLLVQEGDQLFGERITATLCGSPIVLSRARFFERDGRVRLETNVRANALPLDTEHLQFFLDTKTVRALIDGLHLSGTVDIENGELAVTTMPGSAAGSVRFSGPVTAHDAFVDLGLPLAIGHAAIDISDLIYEGGHVRLDAAVEGLQGRVADRLLEDTRLRFTYVEPHLSILELAGALEKGKLRQMAGHGAQSSSAFSIDLVDPYPFDLAIRLDEVDVAGLLHGVFESDFASTGLLSGELRLAGDLERMTGITGDGSVELKDTTLWSIPVVREIFAQLGADSAAVFERVRSRFRIGDGAIHINDVHVYSPLLQLVGEGTLDFDGSLHQDLEVRYSLVDKLGPFRRLLYWVQNNLLRIAVRGDMARPQVQVKGALGMMSSDSGIEHALPLPSFAPLPARF